MDPHAPDANELNVQLAEFDAALNDVGAGENTDGLDIANIGSQ